MTANRKIGFHYFNDTKHYSKAYLTKWYDSVGENVQWMCLKSSCSTAIPEVVLQFCEEKGIRPIIQFDLIAWHKAASQEFISLLKYYKLHGVEFIQLDGDLNQRKTWGGMACEGSYLSMVSSVVLEFQRIAQEFGLWHVLPNLVPGGDYWDLVVLKHILRQMRESHVNTDTVVLSFTPLINGHPLMWGKGGKRKWTEPQPYQEKFNGEDHRGFMGFEWYQEIAMEELGKKLPILLLRTGNDILEQDDCAFLPKIKELLAFVAEGKRESSFEKVVGICFSFHEPVFTKEVASFLGETLFNYKPDERKSATQREPVAPIAIKNMAKQKTEKCISHYLLLPQYDWGISPWHLEVALPFIRKYKPTIGYSVQEAVQASLVTIVMDADVFSQRDIDGLKTKGCKVTIIQGDGTEVADMLSEQ